MTERPLSYQRLPHPLMQFDSGCTECALGHTREYYNEQEEDESKRKYAVGGAGPDDLTKVKLICVSDHISHYEAQESYPFVSTIELHGERTKNGLLRPNNAGSFLRMALNMMFDLDTYNDVWMTNALKCDPGKNKPKFNQHVKPCALHWLQTELQILDEHAPNTPLLIAGGTAFEAMKLLYPEQARMLTTLKLNGCRRRDDIRLGNRPAVFTLNPSRPSRCEPRLESRVAYVKGQYRIKRNEWLYPPLKGSPVYSFIEDLKFLAPFLLGQ